MKNSKPGWLRRHLPRHATIVAYLALTIALIMPASAAVHIMIRSGNIVNGQVKRVDLGRSAVNSAKVGNNTLTGSDIRENSLRVTRISNHIRGAQTVGAPESPLNAPYPLAHNRYRQPAGSSELYFGRFKVNFTPGCLTPSGGNRTATVAVFVNGKNMGSGFGSDGGTGSVTKSFPILVVGGGFAIPTAQNRHVTAQVSSHCDTGSSDVPNIIGVSLDVARFR
jgi:hypothetical protein